MTTFIVDSHSAACDSLWTDGHGNTVQSTLYKYLFIPEDDMVRQGEAASAFYYAGSAEAILMHQAFAVGVLTADQYLVWAENLKRPALALPWAFVKLS